MSSAREDGGDASHFFDWGKSKRRKKLQQLETLYRLARTVEEQTTYLRELTQENKEHAQALTKARLEIEHLSGRRHVLEESLSMTRDELTDTRERLEGSEKRLLEANMNLSVIEGAHQTLTSTLTDQEETILVLQGDIASMKAKIKDLKAAKAAADKEVSDANASLKAKDREIKEQQYKIDEAEREAAQFSVELTDERSRRCTLDMKLNDLQLLVREMSAHAQEVQRQLEIEIECLNFNVVTLTRTVKKKSREIDQLNKDKRLIVSYYTKLLGKGTTGQLHDTQDLMANEEKDLLVNKVLRLESALYRRRLLIDLLVVLLESYDPDFRLDTDPHFQCYLTDDEAHVPQLTYEEMVDIYANTDVLIDPDVLDSDPVVITTSSDTRNNMMFEAVGTNTKILYLRRNV